QHLPVGQYHLYVAGQCGHPGEVYGFQRFRGEHRNHARHRRGFRGVDLLDSRVAVRRAREVAKKHAWQLQVIDKIPLSLDEADVLDALPLATHALELFGAFGGAWCGSVHSAASSNGTPCSLAAAY